MKVSSYDWTLVTLRSCKDSINSRHLDTLDLTVTDVLPNFRDISLVGKLRPHESHYEKSPLIKRKKNRLEDLKTGVRACEDQRLTHSDLLTHFGKSISRLCKDEEEQNPAPFFYCWFDSYDNEENSVTYENQVLKWQTKAKNPFKNEGTRVPRKWIRQSNDPTQVKTEERRVLGPVRNQGKNRFVRHEGHHHICWIYVVVDLISSIRVIQEIDTDFTTLSVKEICCHADPVTRD
ncbi:unnamed protein product [Arabis nemorensis]|uniref:Uncharacterized protein n=1 Tax=Arabis nemorensis TaxID=586526 RepID=A0A565CSH2_9BRAS|nr:unnamed protein product [Arabis nemorensis]